MKTKLFIATLTLLFATSFAQTRTTVNATSSEISDNLDLRSIASIFGDSENLDDFERRINDPKTQISNLDLNNDNQVDYLRVIESIEGNAHLIVVQSVLGRDMFQDVATIEVVRENNRVQVQVVGDVYMYGSNYIYEPVYVHSPIIFNHFWVPNYRPYCSTWYWGYYPTYYSFWQPYPVFRYRNNIALWINFNHQYNYVNNRRCLVAYNNYYNRRGNYYERQNPNRSFANRNSGYTNRHELEQTRSTTRKNVAFSGTRSTDRNATIGSTTRSNQSIRTNNSNPVRETTRSQSIRTNDASPVRETTRSQSVRTNDASPVRTTTRTQTMSQTAPTRSTSTTRNTSQTTRQNSTTRSDSSPSRSSGTMSQGSSSRSGSSRGNTSNSRR